MTSLITLQQVTKVYTGRLLFQNISLTLHPGECVALTGANGCGKSTLLRIIAGLTVPSGGTVTRKAGLKIQYVPDVFPRLSLRQRQWTRALERIDCENLTEGMRSFFLPEDGDQTLKTFSKGMLSKVSLLQALCAPADVFLLDEPGSGLDVDSRERFLEEIRVRLQSGVGIVLATHGQAELKSLAHRVLHFEEGLLSETKESSFIPVPDTVAGCVKPAFSIDGTACLCS